MPVAYRILEELDLVVSTWTGRVSLEEAMAHNDALRRDPDFHPAMRQLSDARRAVSQVNAEGVRILAKSSAFGPEARRAVVARDDDTYAVSRMYEAQATTAGVVGVFRSRAEALAWLDIDPEALPDGLSEG